MLTPLTELLLLVGGLYFLECLRWVSPSSIGIQSLFPGDRAVVRPRKIGSHWFRAPLLVAPWPPFGSLFITDDLPIRLSPKGIVLPSHRTEVLTLPSDDDERVSPEELAIVGTELRLGDRTVAVFGTRTLARRVRKLLSDGADETSLRSFFEERFDEAEARRRLASWRRLSAPLIVASHLLFAMLSMTLLVLVWTPFGLRLFVSLGLLLGCWLFTGLLFEWTLRRVLPKSVRPPVSRRLVTLLSPLSLIRAPDEIRCELLGDFDPLTVACVLLPPKALEPFARDTIAALAHPVFPERPSADPLVQDVDLWHRELQRRMVRRLLTANGASYETFLDAPPSKDGANEWCPRCRATFVTQRSTCSSCRGVALRRFAGS